MQTLSNPAGWNMRAHSALCRSTGAHGSYFCYNACFAEAAVAVVSSSVLLWRYAKRKKLCCWQSHLEENKKSDRRHTAASFFLVDICHDIIAIHMKNVSTLLSLLFPGQIVDWFVVRHDALWWVITRTLLWTAALYVILFFCLIIEV